MNAGIALLMPHQPSGNGRPRPTPRGNAPSRRENATAIPNSMFHSQTRCSRPTGQKREERIRVGVEASRPASMQMAKMEVKLKKLKMLTEKLQTDAAAKWQARFAVGPGMAGVRRAPSLRQGRSAPEHGRRWQLPNPRAAFPDALPAFDMQKCRDAPRLLYEVLITSRSRIMPSLKMHLY